MNWVKYRLNNVTFPGAGMTSSNVVSVHVAEATVNSTANTNEIAVVVGTEVPPSSTDVTSTGNGNVMSTSSNVTISHASNDASIASSTGNDNTILLPTSNSERNRTLPLSQQSTFSHLSNFGGTKELELYNKYQFTNMEHFIAAIQYSSSNGNVDENKILRYIRTNKTHSYRNGDE